MQSCIIRLPDILVSRLSIYRDYIFFFHPLPPQLAERSLTKTGHMLGSKCDLKTHVQNVGYPLPPANRRPKNHFSR